jgi:dUTP pyrophosphatase
MKLKVFRVRDNAKLPTRAHDGDAGMDLYYCAAKNDHTSICVRPGETALFPTGIKAEVPKGFMLEVKNKSSVAAKKQLLVGACVVDSGYDGEIFVNLHNTGKQTQWFRDGDKVAQGVLVPVNLCEIEEVSDPSELNKDSTRGEGALGSTGSR